MEEQVHRAQASDAVHQLHAAQGVVPEVTLLVLIELVVGGDVGVSREEKAAGATRRISDDLSRPRPHAVHQGVDQGPRREILARTALGILGVPFQ